ncbi:uncharacterized protein LOC127870949 [Dreissena polymorpha]|nr:uncharacterized protein LOC127870949 [Dreissena polymorpha]
MTNTPALYEKGLFFRQLKDPAKAYDIFKKVIKDERCPRVYLANAYEQAAYCILDMQPNENDSYKEFDMKYYLKRSVEISCYIVEKIPFLKNFWRAAPTLLDFLKGRAKTTETLRDIGFLYERMDNYENSIDVYKELLETVEDTAELEKKIEIITNLIKTYIHTKRYDDAVLAFDTIMCLPDGRSYIDANLYIDVHIEGGLQSLIKGEHVIAQLRLKNAIQFNKNTNVDIEVTDNTSNDENDAIGQKFDIYILCEDARAEKTFMILLGNLKSLGLSVTLNAVDVPHCQLTMEGIPLVMKASDHFIIALEANPTRSLHTGWQ